MSAVSPRSKATKGFVAAFLILCLAGGGWLWLRSRKPAVIYKESVVARGDLDVSLMATGTVQPENRLEIKPPIAGRVEQVLVKEGQKVAKGQLLAWMSSTERAALLDAARSQGVDEVKRWESLYRPTPVIAPIAGTIILRSVESGQTFTNTDPILVMSDRLTVKAQVDETDIAQIKLKQRALLVLDAYADQRVPARVDQIAFEAKTVNNVTTYVVDVLPETTPEFMRAGMTANVTFVVESRANAILVPNEAIKAPESGGKTGGASVLVRGAGGEPIEKPVQLGISDGKRTEVLSGLAENEVVLAAQLPPRGGKSAPASSPFGLGGGRPRGAGGRR